MNVNKNKQEELIKDQLDIPEIDFKLFQACNSTNKNWFHKYGFYRIKEKILIEKGHFNDYDLQIIKVKCNNCKGTGEHWNGEMCNRCNSGIYQVHRIVLKRYILNNSIFHIPAIRKNDEETYMALDELLIYKNTIEGIIRHEVDTSINEDYALLCLYYKYDNSEFYTRLKSMSSLIRTKAKNNLNKALMGPLHILVKLWNYYKIEGDQQFKYHHHNY